MTTLFRLLALPITLLVTLTISGCGGGGVDSVIYLPVTYGKLTLTIVDGMSDPLNPTGIADANILLLDASGDPVKNFTSTIDGTVTSQVLLTGSYQLKVSANGFNPSPAPKVPPLPVQIVINQTTDITITLYPHDDAGTLGTITGHVTNTVGNGIAGALVIANSGETSVTTISAADGSYILHNVPTGTAELSAFLKGINFLPITSDTVTVDGTTADQNIVAGSVATGVISGSVSFVAGVPAVAVDITLLHPDTREIIPGMRVYIDDTKNYTMTGIPDGHFEIIASLLNDGIVLDPDLNVTQGIPTVDVTGGTAAPLDIDFKTTGAVVLDTPQTPTNYEVPVLSNSPTFVWHQASSYSSVIDYVIEVVDESGNTIWGGLDDLDLDGKPSVRVSKDTTTIVYNDGGTGSALLYPLDPDRYYQLRIYAIKYVGIDLTYPDGIQTLSTTENLDGVFIVEEAP